MPGHRGHGRATVRTGEIRRHPDGRTFMVRSTDDRNAHLTPARPLLDNEVALHGWPAGWTQDHHQQTTRRRLTTIGPWPVVTGRLP